MRRAVRFLVHPGFRLLDLSGPLAAFQVAGDLATGAAYRFRVVSRYGGAVRSSSGVEIVAEPARNARLEAVMNLRLRSCQAASKASMFFLERKNQRTFLHKGPGGRAGQEPNGESLFASFSSEKKACWLKLMQRIRSWQRRMPSLDPHPIQ